MNGIYAIKPKFQQLLRPSESVLISLGVHPDVITLTALGLSAAGGFALFFAQQPGMLPLLCTMPVVTLGRTILNALDGMVAKDTGLARPWGEVLNEFSDRLADLALFGGLIFSRLCNQQLMCASLMAVVLSSYLGILAKAAGTTRQYGGVMGKADRMILLALAGPLAFILAVTGVCQPHTVFDVFALLVALLISVVTSSALANIAAFIFGNLLGGTKLAPEISPNKTWWGVVGSFIGAYFGFGVLAQTTCLNLPLWQFLLIPVVVAASGIVGDLFESFLKRSYKIKDAGSWLPGFGGALDRVDGLLFVIPCAYYLFSL